jgi:hypothetical protein
MDPAPTGAVADSAISPRSRGSAARNHAIASVERLVVNVRSVT